MYTRAPRGLAIILAVTHLTACTSWRAAGVTPAELGPRGVISQLRVTLHTGERMVLRNAVVSGDSIRAEPAPVALMNVQAIDTRRFSLNRTLLLVGIAPAIYVGLAYGVWGGGQE